MKTSIPLFIKDVDSYVVPEDAPNYKFTGRIIDAVKEEDGIHFFAIYEDIEDEHTNRFACIEVCNGIYLYDIETFLSERLIDDFEESYNKEKGAE